MSRLERIVRRVGGVLYDNGRRALIPGPGHSPHDRSVSLLMTASGRILVHCFSPHDDPAAVLTWLSDFEVDGGSPRKRPPPRLGVAMRTARARRLWSESVAVAGTLAESHLRARGIRRTLRSKALRFHPRATSIDDRTRRPAVIVAISDALGGVQGVEITLLERWGQGKARVATPRRIVGRLSGGVVRLDPVRTALLVAEGVASALSASEALAMPAWACLGAFNLEKFTPPNSVKRLVIAADRDEAGLKAARRLRSRLAWRIRVDIEAAPPPFKDWNDWLRDRHR